MVLDEDGFTVAEASEAIGCSERTVRRYIKRGLLVRVNKARPARYSAESIAALKGGVSSVLLQLAAINAQLTELTIRMRVLETVFMARGNLIEPTEKLVRDLKAAALDAMKGPITLDTAVDWADDLTRYSPELCKKVGYSLLDSLGRALLYAAEANTDLRRVSTKRVTVEQLRWFLVQIGEYLRARPLLLGRQ